MIIRYLADSGDITGVFPAEHWQGHVPDGHAYVELILDEAQAESLMASPASYVVRDDGSGPELYERDAA